MGGVKRRMGMSEKKSGLEKVRGVGQLGLQFRA